MSETVADIEAIVTSLALYVDKQQKDINVLVDELNSKQINMDNLEIINGILYSSIQHSLDINRSYFEEIINKGLKTVFIDEVIVFKLQNSIKRGKTSYEIILSCDGVEGSINSFGGGILCVVSLLLKICMNTVLDYPKFLVFDESLSFLSETHHRRVGLFLNSICKELGYDVLLITHQPLIAEQSNTQYVFSKRGGESIIESVYNEGV